MQLNMFESPSEEITLPDGTLYYSTSLLSSMQVERFYPLLQTLNWQTAEVILYGKKHKIPRLQCFYGEELSYTYSNTRFQTDKWQFPLVELKEIAEDYIAQTTGKIVNFNCMLGNLYRNGQDCMGWHADDEAELGEDPVIASFSFGAERDFHLKHKNKPLKHSVILNHGSLLIMAGKTQEFWYHSLPKRTRVTQSRINLTFRTVLT